jgi:hypothetical protein
MAVGGSVGDMQLGGAELCCLFGQGVQACSLSFGEASYLGGLVWECLHGWARVDHGQRGKKKKKYNEHITTSYLLSPPSFGTC